MGICEELGDTIEEGVSDVDDGSEDGVSVGVSTSTGLGGSGVEVSKGTGVSEDLPPPKRLSSKLGPPKRVGNNPGKNTDSDGP